MNDTLEPGQFRTEPENTGELIDMLKMRIEEAPESPDAVAALKQLYAVFTTTGADEDALFYGSCVQMAYEGTPLAAAAFCQCIPAMIRKRLTGEIRNGCRVVAERFPGTAWAAVCRRTLGRIGREATPRHAREAVVLAEPAVF